MCVKKQKKILATTMHIKLLCDISKFDLWRSGGSVYYVLGWISYPVSVDIFRGKWIIKDIISYANKKLWFHKDFEVP